MISHIITATRAASDSSVLAEEMRAATQQETNLFRIGDLVERILSHCDPITANTLAQTSGCFRHLLCNLPKEAFHEPHRHPISEILLNALGPRIELIHQNETFNFDRRTYTTKDYRVALRIMTGPFWRHIFTFAQQEVLRHVYDLHKELDSGRTSLDILVPLLEAIPNESTLEAILSHPKLERFLESLSGPEIFATLMCYLQEILKVDQPENPPSSVHKTILFTLAELIFTSLDRVEALNEEELTTIIGVLVTISDKLEFLPVFEEAISSGRFAQPYIDSITIASALGKSVIVASLLANPAIADMLSKESFNWAIKNASRNGYWNIVHLLLADPTRRAMLDTPCSV